MSTVQTFPRALAAIGLQPGFTNEQFYYLMELERSDETCQLAHQEWLGLQGEEYNNSPYRWYLSYVYIKSEFTRDMAYAYKRKYKNKNNQP